MQQNNYKKRTKDQACLLFSLMFYSNSLNKMHLFGSSFILLSFKSSLWHGWFMAGNTWQHPTKSGGLRYYFPLIHISMLKTYVTKWFFPEMLVIKNSAIWLDKKQSWPKPTKRGISYTTFPWSLSLSYDKILIKILIIPYRDVDDQRILQPHWKSGTSGHTQTKVLVSGAAFP